ncbi:hypothetical protein T06_2313 [Trichinella sp. T6]|nr:hypothetical protein T06_2313 [Trichinella sp. T6]
MADVPELHLVPNRCGIWSNSVLGISSILSMMNQTYRISPIDYHQFWQLSIHASGVGASRRVIASSS